jgi:hypothetical protein
VGALAVVLIVAGCGGGSGDEKTASISKTEFVRKANALCTKGEEKLHSDFVAFSNEKNNNPTPSRAEYEEFINRVISPNLKREIAELQALGTPQGDEAQVEALLAAVEEGLQNAEEKPELVTVGNSELFAKAIKLATAYGLAACAQSY